LHYTDVELKPAVIFTSYDGSRRNIIEVINDDLGPVHSSMFQVQTKFKLFIEFTPYDEILNHRIRTWSMELESCQEFFMNEITKVKKSLPLTHVGMPQQTMACLSMSRILEPMQMLMSQSKTSGVGFFSQYHSFLYVMFYGHSFR
uniref:DNA-directed RNA polymerase n=1 Tax=Angiostrongylus cantonensis TaxID=6313 RepID=A0A0K0D8V5_ANGCA